MKIFRFCKKYLIKYKLNLSVYILISLITTIIGILSTYIMGRFLDSLIISDSTSVILQFCLFFAILNILKIMLGYISSIIYVKMQMQMGNELNCDVIYYIQSLSLSYINKNDRAYLNQRVNNDSNELIIFCITIIQNVIANTVMIVVPFIVLLYMNWGITVILLALIVIYIVLFKIFRRPLYSANFLFRENQSKFFSSLYDQFKYIELIKINSVQSEINNRLDENFNTLKYSAIKNQKITYLYSSLDGLLGIVAQIILFIIGGLQILNGTFTIGMFTIFISYFNVMVNSANYFFNLGASYQSKLVSYNRLIEIYAQNKEHIGTKIVNDVDKISFKNVNFAYANKKILKNFNTEFEKGKIYGVVGANGNGKSTLAKLLLGLYVNEQEGNIFYDDINIKNLNTLWLRKKIIGFAEQEPLLINDTIRFNLTFGEDIDLLCLDQYLDLLNMNEFISSLENGIDSFINEKNSNISGGEKQKISILKVLLKNPKIMIFDEPTSALDLETAKNFLAYLKEIKKDKIIIIITHDNYLKNNADLILEL